MAQSTDRGHFFQSEASEQTAARKAAKSSNSRGEPIRLPSKLLAVVADPEDADAVYVAESAGAVRRVDLKTKDFKTEVYRGASAPLTSLCIHKGRIYAGCWDKLIWSWPRNLSEAKPSNSTTKPGDVQRFHGHGDFVKAVACATLPGLGDKENQGILISGGQDAKIIIWDATSTAKLHVLTGHQRGVLCLAVDQLSDRLDIFSGGSDGQLHCWRLTSAGTAGAVSQQMLAEEAELPEEQRDVLDGAKVNETSINALRFTDTSDDEDGAARLLLTASSDKTARVATAAGNRLSSAVSSKKALSLQHPDFVRDIIALQGAQDEGLVATACRDEGVRVWDVDEAVATLLHCFDGHYEEVTGLAVAGRRLVSVSIDGTLRTWPASRQGIAQERSRELAESEQGGARAEEKKQRKVTLDADEEAELAALMDEDDGD